MSQEPPYPLNQPQITSDISEILSAHGAAFDGATWLLMEEMLYPYEEVFFVAAVAPETVRLARNTISTGFELSESPHGFVLRVSITFADYATPTVVETFLNPETDAVRKWLDILSRQPHFNLVTMDKDEGEEIKTSRHPLDQQLRETMPQILEACPHSEPSLERWQSAVDFYHSHTEPAPGHVRLNKEDPVYKASRNDPCPCGSGKKFKRCHGQ